MSTQVADNPSARIAAAEPAIHAIAKAILKQCWVMSYEDLLQIGRIAVWKCAPDSPPWKIRNQIKWRMWDAIREQSWLSRKAASCKEEGLHYAEHLYQDGGIPCYQPDQRGRIMGSGRDWLSLHRHVGKAGSGRFQRPTYLLAILVRQKRNGQHAADDADEMRWFMAEGERLFARRGQPRRWKMLVLYYREGWTLKNIGRLFGLSESRMSQWRKNALAVARAHFSAISTN